MIATLSGSVYDVAWLPSVEDELGLLACCAIVGCDFSFQCLTYRTVKMINMRRCSSASLNQCEVAFKSVICELIGSYLKRPRIYRISSTRS